MTYAVKLESFEGPLDLLLHLIAKAQVDIKDIFVSEITDQYLSYLEQMEQLDMEQATEFLTMAATLLNIKSRSLLPKPRKWYRVCVITSTENAAKWVCIWR